MMMKKKKMMKTTHSQMMELLLPNGAILLRLRNLRLGLVTGLILSHRPLTFQVQVHLTMRNVHL